MYDGNDCNATEDLGTIMRSMDFCWFTQYSVILMRLLHVVADTASEAYKSRAGVQVNACMQELNLSAKVFAHRV